MKNATLRPRLVTWKAEGLAPYRGDTYTACMQLLPVTLSKTSAVIRTISSAPRVELEAQRHLLIMACSQTKSNRGDRAFDLYRGVMYQTYRAHVQPQARPHVVILSAEHGFLSPWEHIEPYDRRMDRARAEEMLANMPSFMKGLQWPRGVRSVVLCGGAEYRKVMEAAVRLQMARGRIDATATIRSLSGGIGDQRSQLGRFLDGLRDPLPVAGWHPNGEVALYHSMDGWNVGDRVTVPASKGNPVGTIRELFHGPNGPTACVWFDKAFRCRAHPRWVGTDQLAQLGGFAAAETIATAAIMQAAASSRGRVNRLKPASEAGALILAEIERFDRAAMAAATSAGKGGQV